MIHLGISCNAEKDEEYICQNLKTVNIDATSFQKFLSALGRLTRKEKKSVIKTSMMRIIVKIIFMDVL